MRNQRHTRGKCHVKTETHKEKTNVWRQWQRLELRCHRPRNTWATRGWKKQTNKQKDPSPRGFKGSMALPTLDFGFSNSRTVREHISFVLSHPVSGTLFQESSVTNIDPTLVPDSYCSAHHTQPQQRTDEGTELFLPWVSFSGGNTSLSTSIQKSVVNTATRQWPIRGIGLPWFA